jgi:hypothetical protein
MESPMRPLYARLIGVLLLAGLSACAASGVGPDAIAGKVPDARVDLQAVQAAYIGSGSAGSGTLIYRGKLYPFNIGGAGIGGIGVSSVDGDGEVYNLHELSQFPGAYAQGRYGFAVGDKSAGDLWLQNDQGVIMHIKAKRTGLMLTLGGDAMVIAFKP